MPDEPERLKSESPALELPHPRAVTTAVTNAPDARWTITAHSKSALRGWKDICGQIHENAIRCYEWLRTTPTRGIPGRCYPLKHSRYAGCWGYEVGAGQRVYYRPNPETKRVLVYYAGPHPTKIPYPPKS